MVEFVHITGDHFKIKFFLKFITILAWWRHLDPQNSFFWAFISVEYKDFWAAGSVFRQQEICAGSFIGISGTTSGSFEELPEIFENKNKVPELPEILN